MTASEDHREPFRVSMANCTDEGLKAGYGQMSGVERNVFCNAPPDNYRNEHEWSATLHHGEVMP